VGLGLRYELPLSHSDTRHSVELLWTSDRPAAETSAWQHTSLTRERHPCFRRDSHLQSQEASDRRPTPLTPRPPESASMICTSRQMELSLSSREGSDCRGDWDGLWKSETNRPTGGCRGDSAIIFEGANLIHLAQNKFKWRILVNTKMNLQVSWPA
jgi:hypothetical protein